MNLLKRLFDQPPPKKIKTVQANHEEPQDYRMRFVSRLSMENNWLCPYGPDRIDETHRFSNIVQPVCIKNKWYDMMDASNFEWEHIPLSEILDLLRDDKWQWDRIIVPVYSSEIFDLLHLHPCEELYLDFNLVTLSSADVRNIAKCTSLRLLNMGCNHISTADIGALSHLSNLSKFSYDISESPFSCLEALRQLPGLTMLQINSSYSCPVNSPSFPFEENEIVETLSCISESNDSIRELYIGITLGPVVLPVLGQLTNIESIFVENSEIRYTGFDLQFLFMSPSLHKSVRNIHLSHTQFGGSVVSHLPKFTKLQTIDLRGVDISTDTLLALLRANADHLEALTVSLCRAVDDTLLEGVARCKCLKVAEILDTAVTAGAVERYKKAKRPNWQILVHREFLVRAKNSQNTQNE